MTRSNRESITVVGRARRGHRQGGQAAGDAGGGGGGEAGARRRRGGLEAAADQRRPADRRAPGEHTSAMFHAVVGVEFQAALVPLTEWE